MNAPRSVGSSRRFHGVAPNSGRANCSKSILLALETNPDSTKSYRSKDRPHIPEPNANGQHNEEWVTSMLVVCQEKTRVLKARTGGRAVRISIRIFGYATAPLGGWFLRSPAEPDIHLQSETPRSPHRRLSLGSLPVPKQFGVSLGSLTPLPSRPHAGPGSLRIDES
jgi:hypothetical protein